MRSSASQVFTSRIFHISIHLLPLPHPLHTHTSKETRMQKTQEFPIQLIKRISRHCYSVHVGFPSATQAQQELRIFLATSPLAAIQYLQREREGRQESPWGHCPVRGQTNTDQVPQKLSATSTPNLRTETKAPHTQNKDKILKLRNKKKEIPQPPGHYVAADCCELIHP